MSTFREIINGDIPVLVDFYAEWCGPCKTMAPFIKSIASAMEGEVRVLKVDVDKNPAAAQAYNIQGVPSFIIFKRGVICWRQAGAMPEHVLKEALAEVLREKPGR